MILNYHQESNNPNIAIIGLHGWTGTEHSMVPVARAMRIQSAKWYIPRAPYKASAGQGHTWFSGSPDNGWKVKKTFNLLDTLIQQVQNDGFDPENIILFGFSMGGSLSLRYGLGMQCQLRGIIPVAAWVREPEELINSASLESKQTPILMIHGKDDSVVDHKKSITAAAEMKNNGFSIHLEIVSGGHIIGVYATNLIKQFIETGKLDNLHLAS
jgi:phospholipase/carboxylesterase